MKYNVEWAKTQTDKEFIFFYGHTPKENGKVNKSCFSQWYAHNPFDSDGITYHTAEHYMMAKKAELFGDEDARLKIINNPDPKYVKACGRLILDFDPITWDKHKFDIVTKGSILKFSQHEELKEFILNTEDAILVEASPYDTIWGIGLSIEDAKKVTPNEWKGENLLGFALMEARDYLKTI